MRKHILLFCCAASAMTTGCRPAAEPADGNAGVAIIDEVRAGTPLDDMLRMLDERLAAAMAGPLEGSASEEFARAEAITDRLLEARVPFEWLTAEQYSLESRLRQVQSSADRILAQMQTGVAADTIVKNLTELRQDVARLRETVARGGTRAPPPVDRLLAGDTTDVVDLPGAGEVPAPARADTTPRPIGNPVGIPVSTGGL
jgi:hypothetical protein